MKITNYTLFIIFLVSNFCTYSNAQIKIREINQKEETIYKNPLVRLDSTKNIIIYPDLQRSSQYIGSKIIYCPLSENSSAYGICDDLYYYSGTNIEFVLDINNKVARYKINGKILNIDSLLIHNNKYNQKKLYYILSDSHKNRYLWNISSIHTGTRDALLIPFLNYISQKYTGVKYTPNKNLKNTETNYIYDLTDIDTGEDKIIIKNGEVFTCTGVEFMKANFATPLLNPFLILKSNNTTIRVSFMNKLIGSKFDTSSISFRPNIQKDFISIKNLNAFRNKQKEQEEFLKKKYGETISNLITNKKVKIGMTKEMCLEAWGKPNRINNTINSKGTYEQWVYDTGNYLYFNNGILETIQNMP